VAGGDGFFAPIGGNEETVMGFSHDFVFCLCLLPGWQRGAICDLHTDKNNNCWGCEIEGSGPLEMAALDEEKTNLQLMAEVPGNLCCAGGCIIPISTFRSMQFPLSSPLQFE